MLEAELELKIILDAWSRRLKFEFWLHSPALHHQDVWEKYNPQYKCNFDMVCTAWVFTV